MLKKTIVAGAVAATLGSGLALAQQQPASPHTFTGNVGLYSQYIFRGLTQTNGDPAIQGGFDYSHASGFYAGTWASNISWLKENFSTPGVTAGQYSGGGSMEWDFYGGYKWGFAPDWTLDLGGIYYYYPGDVTRGCVIGAVGCPKGDTFEVYAGLSWKWLSAKINYSVDNKTFGLPSSDGTYYLDFSLNLPLGDLSKEMTGFTLMAHYGIQKYDGQIAGVTTVTGAPLSNDTLASYEDWKIGISYALPKDFTIGVYYSDTSGTNRAYYGSTTEGGPFPRNISKGTGVIYIQKTF